MPDADSPGEAVDACVDDRFRFCPLSQKGYAGVAAFSCDADIYVVNEPTVVRDEIEVNRAGVPCADNDYKVDGAVAECLVALAVR